MGIDDEKIYGVAYGLSAALMAIAAAVLVPFFYVHPGVGTSFLLKVFVIVVLGGIGSMPGAAIGGLLVGGIEGVVGLYVQAAVAQIVLFAIFVGVLFVRPGGPARRGAAVTPASRLGRGRPRRRPARAGARAPPHHARAPRGRRLLDPDGHLGDVLRLPERGVEHHRRLRRPVLDRPLGPRGHRRLHVLAAAHPRRPEPVARHARRRRARRPGGRPHRVPVLPAPRRVLLAGDHRVRGDAAGRRGAHRHAVRPAPERRARAAASRGGRPPVALPVHGQAPVLLRHAGAPARRAGRGMAREALAARLLPGRHPGRRGRGRGARRQPRAREARGDDGEQLLRGDRGHLLRAARGLHHPHADDERRLLRPDGRHGRAGRRGHRARPGVGRPRAGAHRGDHARRVGRQLPGRAPDRLRRAAHGRDPLLAPGDRPVGAPRRRCPRAAPAVLGGARGRASRTRRARSCPSAGCSRPRWRPTGAGRC